MKLLCSANTGKDSCDVNTSFPLSAITYLSKSIHTEYFALININLKLKFCAKARFFLLILLESNHIAPRLLGAGTSNTKIHRANDYNCKIHRFEILRYNISTKDLSCARGYKREKFRFQVKYLRNIMERLRCV